MIHDVLFYGQDHFRFVEDRKQAMLGKIERMPRDQIVGADLDALTTQLVDQFAISVPVLHPDQKTGEAHDIKIDISGDPTRLFFHAGIGEPEVDGTRITISVPFDGDPEVFSIKPPTFNFNPPHGEVVGQSVVCHIEDTDISDEKVSRAFSSWLQSVEQYLGWHRNAAVEANRTISGAARTALAQRQHKLRSVGSALAGLGIGAAAPARATPVVSANPAQGSATTPTPTPTATPQYFDCFVSYASEDRAMVGSLVQALAHQKIRVWWDKRQITLGDRLSKKIDEGLSKSRYGLVIISPSFVAKRWPGAELRALANRAISSGHKVLLPVLVGMNHDEFAATYPLLSDIVSTTFTGDYDALVDEIVRAMN